MTKAALAARLIFGHVSGVDVSLRVLGFGPACDMSISRCIRWILLP